MNIDSIALTGTYASSTGIYDLTFTVPFINVLGITILIIIMLLGFNFMFNLLKK